MLSLGLICSCRSESQIEFHICGNVQVPEQIDAIRVSILNDSMAEVQAGLIELEPRDPISVEGEVDGSPEDETKDLDGAIDSDGNDANPLSEGSTGSGPFELPITVSLPNHHGSGFLRIQGLLDGVETARFDRTVDDFERIDEVDMSLTKQCYGRMSCSLGQTCIKGDCKLAPPVGSAPFCR